MIPESEWEWLGHACHFIGGENCLFHLATKVGPFLVSTVGDWFPGRGLDYTGKRQRLGISRNSFFETYVFWAGEKRDCGCYQLKDGSEIDGQHYSTGNRATKGHIAFCHKYADIDAEALRKTTP